MHYSTVRVRLTLSDITATRSPEEAPLLANGHDNTKLISYGAIDAMACASRDCKSRPSG